MGFSPSPYLAVRHLALAEEVIRGDRIEINNPFGYDKVILNLLYSESFDASMLWIYKYNSKVERLAGDLVSFIDNMWISGYSIEYCWQCARRIALILQYLGIQEAARKRTLPSLLADA